MKKIKLLLAFAFAFVFANAQTKVTGRVEQKVQQAPVSEDEWSPEMAIKSQYDNLINDYVKNGKFNGTVLIASKGKVVYERGVGLLNAEKKIGHKTNDLFQIGSITKQFTAAVIMQLQNEGKLSVSDKLDKYFPGFINGDKITIEHLLTHTSGLHNYTDDEELLKSDVTKHYSRDEMLKIFKNYKSDFEPGTKWNYSNTGYSILGYIIEKLTGKPYEKVMRERILTPLGMSNTGFNYTGLKHDQKSSGYFSLDGTTILPAPIVDSTIAYSAGALYSNVQDLLKWERAIYTDKILPQASWKKVFTPYKNGYGYGWGIGKTYDKEFMAHSGGIHGFASYILRFPEDELVIIALDNASGTSLSQMTRHLAAISFGKPVALPKAKTEIKVDKSVLQAYEGEFELAPGFSIVIRLDGDALKARATGQEEFQIYAESANMFFYKVVEAKIEFVKDSSGKVSSIILHQGGRDMPGERIK